MKLARIAAGVPLIALLLAGCSSGGGRSLYAGQRPSDACAMLTSDQVEAVVDTPGPFTGAHEDPDENGAPVWGCTWGTQMSYADLREATPERFRYASTPKNGDTLTPLNGIGDKALISSGTLPYLIFAAAGRFYEVEVTIDRHPTPISYTKREAAAEQSLAKIFTAR